MRKRVKSMTHRLWSNLVESLSCDGLSQNASSNPPNPDVQYNGTTRISLITFLFFFSWTRINTDYRQFIRTAWSHWLLFKVLHTHSWVLLTCYLKCSNPQLANECLAMGNNGNFSRHVSTMKENKLSIDANHHQLILTSLPHGITLKTQFIFNWYPSIIQANGIVRHPI